jgi:hypothetical protein
MSVVDQPVLIAGYGSVTCWPARLKEVDLARDVLPRTLSRILG